MGCDYYISTQLVICFKNTELNDKHIQLCCERGYFGFGLDDIDSDDEEYDEKRKNAIEELFSRYDKDKILFNNGKFITDVCRDKYIDRILNAMNRDRLDADDSDEDTDSNNLLTMEDVDTVTKTTYAYERS